MKLITFYVWAIFLICSTAIPSFAESTNEKPTNKKTPEELKFVLTISGGVSQGAYEAGLNWVLVELIKGTDKKPEMGLKPKKLIGVTGSSAGSINALLSMLTYCDGDENGENSKVTENLFWKAWIPIGLDTFFPGNIDRAEYRQQYSNSFKGIEEGIDLGKKLVWEKEEEKGSPFQVYKDDEGLFTRKASQFISGKVKVALDSLERESSCDKFYLGFTLTSLEAYPVKLGESIDAKSHKYIVSLKGEKDDKQNGRFIFNNFTGFRANDKVERIINGKTAILTSSGNIWKLPEEKGWIEPGTIVDVVDASSAYPIAFNPVTLSRGIKNQEEELRVIDGGTFNNVPIGLSVLFINADSKKKVNPVSKVDEGWSRSLARYIYIDPNLRRTLKDEKENSKFPPKSRGFEKLWGPLLGKYIDSIVVTELYNVYWRFPWIREQETKITETDDKKDGHQLDHEILHEEKDIAEQGVGLEIDHKVVHKKEKKTMNLLASSRFPEIVGSYLGHFGAFFDRPFREYDYYAGLYDGLMGVAKYMCNTLPEHEQTRCIGGKLKEYLKRLNMIGADDKPLSGANDALYVIQTLAHLELLVEQEIKLYSEVKSVADRNKQKEPKLLRPGGWEWLECTTFFDKNTVFDKKRYCLEILPQSPDKPLGPNNPNIEFILKSLYMVDERAYCTNLEYAQAKIEKHFDSDNKNTGEKLLTENGLLVDYLNIIEEITKNKKKGDRKYRKTRKYRCSNIKITQSTLKDKSDKGRNGKEIEPPFSAGYLFRNIRQDAEANEKGFTRFLITLKKIGYVTSNPLPSCDGECDKKRTGNRYEMEGRLKAWWRDLDSRPKTLYSDVVKRLNYIERQDGGKAGERVFDAAEFIFGRATGTLKKPGFKFFPTTIPHAHFDKSREKEWAAKAIPYEVGINTTEGGFILAHEPRFTVKDALSFRFPLEFYNKSNKRDQTYASAGYLLTIDTGYSALSSFGLGQAVFYEWGAPWSLSKSTYGERAKFSFFLDSLSLSLSVRDRADWETHYYSITIEDFNGLIYWGLKTFM